VNSLLAARIMVNVVLGICVAGCNTFFELEPTGLDPEPPPDQDGDTLRDEVDNCPAAANSDQVDDDGDGFGDACDLCPAHPTNTNHDEDGDLRGDECDACPVDPDFQNDGDDDGVGDECDNDAATANNLVLFDPFIVLGPAWEPNGTPWQASGDAAAPTAQAADGALLRYTSATISGSKAWWVRMTMSSLEPWNGDEFGVDLVDASSGMRVSGCRVTCAGTSCTLDVYPPSADLPVVVSAVPTASLAFNRTPFLAGCVFDGHVASESSGLPASQTLQIVLVGSPKVRFRHVALWQ
jgi:hypothetical protein